MSDTGEKLRAFETRWRERLEAAASVEFRVGERGDAAIAPYAIADAFAVSQGFKPIGYNWEMLDAMAAEDEARSAIAALADAARHHMAFPKQVWLGADASRFAREFVSAFGSSATILTNRMDFGWHPLTDAQIEWAFVGYDDSHIALVVLTA